MENRLPIAGVDVLDLTPLLDMKPYVPDFDVCTEDARVGCYETRSKTLQLSIKAIDGR